MGNPDFIEHSKEVYYAADSILKLGKKDMEHFKAIATQNERKRSRICAHKDVNDKLHEMFIVLEKNSYIRPHKHFNKSESFHVIDGAVNIILFDENGKIKDIIEMGDYLSGKKFYYRINKPVYHTLLIQSEFLVFHEITNGPFIKSDTIFAPWTPEDDNKVDQKKYLEQLKISIRSFLSDK